jgi:hypothetical protein
METQEAKTSLQDLQSLANTVLDNSDVLKKRKKKRKKGASGHILCIATIKTGPHQSPSRSGIKIDIFFLYIKKMDRLKSTLKSEGTF